MRAYLESSFLPSRYDLSPGTVEQYRIAARLYERAAGECGYPPAIEAVSLETLQAFMGCYSRRVGSSTANKKRSLLLSVAQHAADAGLIQPVAARKLRRLRENRPQPDAWSEQELAAIVASCRQEPFALTGELLDAFIRLAYETGARRGALLAARASDLVGGILTLSAEHQKTRREQRFELSAELVERLGRFGPRERLIPWPWCLRWFARRLKAVVARAGLSATRRDGAHKLRRTHATLVCRALGMEEAREALGHTSDAMTRRYVDRAKLDRPTVQSVLPPIVSPTQLKLFG